MTIYYDKLTDRYIPTDSGWNFHPENTALLPSTEIDGKLVIDATNPLSTDYKQLMYSNVSSGGNATVYYLDMITSKDSGTLPKIMRDAAASNARAIELAPETTMIFRTNYPYNKDRLKKVLCRCRKEAGAPTLHVGVIGIEDKAYRQPDGTYGNNDFYEVTVSGNITELYATYVGYIAGTDTAENIESVSRPNNDPDYPARLLDGTTDIALMIRTGSGTGSIYIDSIELQDTENALTELPKGAMVVNNLEGLTDDNKLSPVEKAYVKTLLAEIDSEYDSVLADGTAAGVDGILLTALTTKYNALHSLVDPLLLDMTKASDITSAFDDAFLEYYSVKTAVQSDISNLHSAEIESLETNVSSISTQVQNHSSLITDINGTLQTQASAISNHTSQISDLTGQISDIDEGWQEFSETIDQNALNISNLTSRVDDAEEDITSVNTTLATHQTNLTSQLASINSLTTSVGTIDGSVTTIQGRLDTAEGDISSQGTQLSGITTRLTSAETSLGSHTTQLTNHQNALNEQADDISTLDSSLTIEKGKIASLATKVTNIEGVNTSQATSITQNADEISTLATRVTSVEGVNTTQGTAITQNADDISSLATRTTTAEGTISNQATLITQNADEISSLATSVNTDISDLEETVDSQSTLITQNADEISSLATRTTTVEGTVASHTTQITQAANGLSSLAGRVTTTEGTISDQATLITQNADEISSLATSVNESLEDIEGSIDSQSTLITQNAGNISSLATRVTTTEGTISDQSTLITQNADEISSLATSTTSSIDALEDTVDEQSTLITQNAGSISSLATRVTSVEGVNTSQATSITQNAGNISSLATRVTTTESSISGLEDTVDGQSTLITQNADEISSLATSTTSSIDALEGTVASQSTLITQNAGNISSLATRVTTTESSISGLEDTVDEQATLITQNADEISSLATRTTTAEGTISNHTTSINQNAGAITSLAKRTTTVEGTVASHTTSINQNADEISSLATRVSSAEGNITNVGTLVSQNADEISSLATKVTNIEGVNTSQDTSITQNAGAITSLANRVTTAEGTISTHSSSITQNANAIATKVTQAQVDTSIATAKSTNYGYRYAKDIIVYGESGKYYPVVIKGGNQNVKRDILVFRAYSEQAPNDWNTSTHKGGLTLKIKTNFGGWGGANYSWEIHELEELYSRTFAGAVNCGNNVMFAIFLRGGGETGAIYHLYSDQSLTSTIYNDNGNIPASPQIAYNQDLIFKSGTYLAYAPVYRTITPAVEEEIRIRKFITLSQSNNTRLNSAETAITQNANSISSLATKVTSVEGGVASNNTLITQTADDLTSLAGRVSSVEGVNTSQATSITQNANSISSLATSTTSSINALEGTVASHSTLITQTADDLTSLAGRVDTTEDSMSSLGTSVSQQAESITLLAGRVDTTEDLISSNTSSISQNADAIELKVEAIDTNGDGVIGAKIEIGSVDGAGQIKLDADKILLDGSVKAGKIDTDDLFSKELTIKEDGSIASSYDDNGEMKRYERGMINSPDLPEDFGGFYLGADGHMELVRVRARDGEYSGELESTDTEGTLLHTQKYELGRPLPISAKTHYLASDISAVFPNKASKEVSINGGSYVHAFKPTIVDGKYNLVARTLDNSRTVALPEIKGSSKVVLHNSTSYISKVEYSKNGGAFTAMSGSVGVSVSQGDIVRIRQSYNNPNAFVPLGQTSRKWSGMTTLGNDVYACQYGGDIYKQTNGTGNFVALGQTSREWYGMTALGNDVYACVFRGDIYKQTNGTGDFVALGQEARLWRGMTTLGNDLYACVDEGDIYKQTNGTGNFVALGQTSREWYGMTALGNDVYACVLNGDIYKQTNGTGNFVALGQTSRKWYGMTTLGNDVYACVYNGDIYKQTNGTGNFVALGQKRTYWWGMTTLGNDVYACVDYGDIYKQSYNPTHQSTISIALPNTETLVLACANTSTANGTYDDFNGEFITFDTANDQSEKSVVIKNGGTTLFDSSLNLYRTFKTVYDELESVGTYALDESQSTFDGTQAGFVVKSQNQLTFLTLAKAVIATIGSTTYTKTDAILYLLGQSRGVKTATLLPETGASVGTVQNPYSEGYFEQVVTDLVDADAINIGGKSQHSFVISSYRSGYQWYRIWSDGWKETGGVFTSTSNGTAQTFTMHSIGGYAFKDKSYSISISIINNAIGTMRSYAHSTTSISAASDGDATVCYVCRGY